MVVALIIFLATVENMLPLIIGFWKTPPGYVFLGTVHHPADYFYYLSQFAQGSERWITSMHLFTAELTGPVLVGWSNVLLGRLFHSIGVSAFTAYHTSVVLLTVALGIAAYLLAHAILGSKTQATLALYLFALFHAFPVLRDGRASYGDYFNNTAVPRVRFGGVPHQLLQNTASMLMAYFILKWVHHNRRSNGILLGLGLSSLVLASLQPVLWALVFGVSVLSSIYTGIRKTKEALPLIIMLLSGLPPLLYLSRIFSTLPFSQLKTWEATQQTLFTTSHFLSATGPIFLVALLLLPLTLRSRRAHSYVLPILFSSISYTLFLSPLPAIFGFSHVRFLSALSVLTVSMIAAAGLSTLAAHNNRWVRRAFGALLIGLTMLLISNHKETLRLSTQFRPQNAYQYLPVPEHDLLVLAGSLGGTRDTYLLAWPYNEIFPGLTGKRSYHGHPLLTIRAAEKIRLADSFFRRAQSDSQIKHFLDTNRITYVIAPTDNRHISSLPLLERKTTMGSLTLYRVRMP